METDVIVIGAGAAGLHAAQRLRRAGLAVRILEARSRVGGRIFTHTVPDLPLPVELGAEFVQAETELMRRYLRRSKIVGLEGEHWCYSDRRLAPCGESFDAVFHGLANPGDEERSFQDYLREAARSGLWNEQEQALAAGYVEGYHGAPLDDISMRSIADQENAAEDAGGSELGRLEEGYAVLLRQMAEGIADLVRMNTVVKEISWKRGRVSVSAVTRTGRALPDFVASAAVITLPLGVLQAGAVRFLPGLPDEAQTAIGRLAVAPVVKLGLRFHEEFWPELNSRFQDLSFIHARKQPFPTLWTLHPLRVPYMTAWAGGPAAARLSGKSEAALVKAAAKTLCAVFGKPAGMFEEMVAGWYVHDWQTDPFTRGAYTYVPVGAIPAQRALAEPIDDTLFFAGEAVHAQGGVGTVHGAMETGQEAARRAIEAFS